MTEHHPADRPGHLDIDAVSAFVDRDFDPDDLATIESHLVECPPCYREVLEIRTTVVLLTGLPQYTPRRSFCLGHEHVRAARRRGRMPRSLSWTDPIAATGYPASAPASVTHGESGRAAGWLPGLQAAAMVVGTLLLLVTTSDLIGMPPQPASWLSESEAPAPQVENLSAPPSETLPPAPAMAPGSAGSDSQTALDPSAANSESLFRSTADESGGTTSDNNASEEVLEDAETANTASSVATSAALAAVTRAVPTPGPGLAQSPETAADGAEAPATTDAQPSRLRMTQLVLAFALAWLVVSIVGLRWVRGLRRAQN